MSSLLNDIAIDKIRSVKKTFLWVAVCILIGEVVAGAFLILFQTMDPILGRLMGTLALCALTLFMGVNSFTRMEKNDRLVQGFALVSLVMNVVWLVLAIMLIWEVVPYYSSTVSYGLYNHTRQSMTIVAKLMLVSADVALMSFLISNVWSIEETVKLVRPLKITALVCELYCGIYGVVVTLGDARYAVDSRWYGLAGLMGLAFIVMACAAAILSKSGRKKSEKNEEVVSKISVDDTEMQAKIQEMVEKEVQARMAAIQKPSAVDDKAESSNSSATSGGNDNQEPISETESLDYQEEQDQ